MEAAPSAIIAPIIHPNGDASDALIAALEAAYRALTSAKQALRDAAPNARNYYPVDGLFTQARAQHDRRVSLLSSMQTDILAELKGIQAQQR